MASNRSIQQVSNLGPAILSAINDPRVSKQIRTAAAKEAIQQTVHPVAQRATAHYENMLQQVIEFIDYSNVDNDFSGKPTIYVNTLEGGTEPVTAITSWNPLSKKYVKQKKSEVMWRNSGRLANAVRPLPSLARYRVHDIRLKTNAAGKIIAKFGYAIQFQNLPEVFQNILNKSFVEGQAVDPAEIPDVIERDIDRNRIDRLIFLEKYRPHVGKGGKGRPMLTAIAGSLGQIMRRDLILLRQGRS